MKADKRGRLPRWRRRLNAWFGLIVGVMILIGAGVGYFSPHDYPAGARENAPDYWIVVGVTALLIASALIVLSIRELRRIPPGDEDD